MFYTADLNNGFYQNPIILGNFPDPSIMRDGEDYYMVNSGMGYRNMVILHSKDLINWEPMYYSCELVDKSPASHLTVFAPELIKYEDKYYIYNFAPGYGIFVISCTDIKKGDWTKPCFLDVAGIDPGHVTDENGNRFLCICGNILYPLTKDGMKIAGEGVKICDIWEMPEEWEIEGVYPEAPKFTKRNGYYYLTISQGGTQGPPTGHCVLSFRSKNLTGPYESSPYNPIIKTWERAEKWWSVGHATLVDTVNGDWHLIYHGILNGRHDLGRIPLLEPLEWTNDDWFKATSNRAEPLKMPCGEKIVSDISLDCDFTKQKSLPILYDALTKSLYESLEFTEKGLEINSENKIAEKADYLWVCSQDLRYEVVIELDKSSTGAFVGMHYDNHYACGILYSDEKVCLYSLENTFLTSRTGKEVKSDKIFLKMRNNNGVVSGFYSTDGENFKKLASSFDITSWNGNSAKGFGFVKPSFGAIGKAVIKNLKYIKL
ncbi:MAG: family 43 glycosylhydrolase [Clostridia bacterium]